MTRQAILIGAANVKPILPGVNQDLIDIKEYLKSNAGGAWNEDEIIILKDESLEMVKQTIAAAKYKDYVFITCSGHGEHRLSSLNDNTVMYLNEKDTIQINEINPQNKRHLVIVDVCRTLVREVNRYTALYESGMENLINKSYIDYRKVFENAIMQTTEGRIVVYSCDINQTAGDDGKGGVFTQELLKSHNNFRPNRDLYGIVNIEQAFTVAKQKTYEKNAPQTAVINAGRRRDYFPFAII